MLSITSHRQPLAHRFATEGDPGCVATVPAAPGREAAPATSAEVRELIFKAHVMEEFCEMVQRYALTLAPHDA